MTEQTAENSFSGEDNPTDYLAELIGDGKKYATVEELAKGAFNAQKHIPTLEQELAELREKQATAKTIEDLLRERITPPNSEPTPKPVETTVSEGEEVPTQESIAEIVRTVMQQDQSRTQQDLNFKTSLETATKSLGTAEAVDSLVNKKATELGLTVSSLREMASKSPSAFFSLVGLDSKQAPTAAYAPSSGGVNTAALGKQSTSVTAEQGTLNHYKQRMKENPKLVHDRSFNAEMSKASQTDPNKFFGREVS